MKSEEIKQLLLAKNWPLLMERFSEDDICELLLFEEVVKLSYELFYENMAEDAIQHYALNLAKKIKEKFPSQWNADWKLDVFLGHMLGLLWEYDKKYECYKSAYDKILDPPDALLLLLAGCISAPGIPPINEEEYESYLKRAVAKKMTYEAAIMMRHFFRTKGDEVQVAYWTALCDDLEKNNIHTETIIPDVLRSIKSM